MIILQYLCTYDDSMIPFNTKVCQIHIFAHNSTGVNDTKKINGNQIQREFEYAYFEPIPDFLCQILTVLEVFKW